MPTKAKRGKTAKKPGARKRRLTAGDRKLVKLYPSLAEGDPPSRRRTALLEEARKRGIRPMTKEKLQAMAGRSG